MIAISWIFDLQAHGVSILGPVPSGLPSFGFPSGVGWDQVPELLATSVSMFLVIIAQSAATSRAYAVKYQDRFVENNDLVGLSFANLAAGLSSTFVVNGSPTKTEMADEAKSRTQVAMLTMAAMVAIVLLFLTYPLQFMPNAVLSAVVFVIGVKLIDLATHEGDLAAAPRRVLGRRGDGRRRRRRRRRAGHHPRDRALGAPAREATLRAARRRGHPGRRTARSACRARPPGVVTEPGLVVYRFGVGLFYANATRLTEEALELVGGPEPPRWFVLHADAIDDVDYTGGKTLVELAEPTRGARRRLRGRRRPRHRAARARALRTDGQDRRGPHLPDARRRRRRLPRRQIAAHIPVPRTGLDAARYRRSMRETPVFRPVAHLPRPGGDLTLRPPRRLAVCRRDLLSRALLADSPRDVRGDDPRPDPVVEQGRPAGTRLGDR